MPTVAPAVPIDPLVQRFADLVRAFETAPSIDRLRELERIAQQLMARLRSLGPAALAIFQGAVARVLVVVLSPTAVVWGGAVIGAGLLWWGFFTVLSGQIDLPDPAETVSGISALIFLSLQTWGLWHPEQIRGHCWDEFVEGLTKAARDAIAEDFTIYTPGFHRKVIDLLDALLDCLFGNVGLGLSGAGRKRLIDLIKKMLENSPLWVALGLAGLSFSGQPAEAAEPSTPAEDEAVEKEVGDAIRRLGLKGVPRGDGFGYCEGLPDEEENNEEGPAETEQPCSPMPWEVDLQIQIPLDGFSDAELMRRKSTLECWKKYYEGEIARDRAELKKAAGNNDSARSDLLRLRIRINTKELNRVCAALQNVNRECQLREIRRQPVRLAPPMESRLKFRFPDFSAPSFFGSFR